MWVFLDGVQIRTRARNYSDSPFFERTHQNGITLFRVPPGSHSLTVCATPFPTKRRIPLETFDGPRITLEIEVPSQQLLDKRATTCLPVLLPSFPHVEVNGILWRAALHDEDHDIETYSTAFLEQSVVITASQTNIIIVDAPTNTRATWQVREELVQMAQQNAQRFIELAAQVQAGAEDLEDMDLDDDSASESSDDADPEEGPPPSGAPQEDGEDDGDDAPRERRVPCYQVQFMGQAWNLPHDVVSAREAMALTQRRVEDFCKEFTRAYLQYAPKASETASSNKKTRFDILE